MLYRADSTGMTASCSPGNLEARVQFSFTRRYGFISKWRFMGVQNNVYFLPRCSV
jgi:hypothetical protein